MSAPHRHSSLVDHFVERAREEGPDWTPDRAVRVLAGAHAMREKRIARDRAVRRGVVGLGVAAFIGFVLLRGAGATTPAPQAAAPTASPEPIAVHASNDGGYARD